MGVASHSRGGGWGEASGGESHTALCKMGCTNWGLTYEKPSKSDWSMLAMTNWSGGVKTGCPRVKNLSKFSAPLPHCGEKRKERSVGVPPPTGGSSPQGRPGPQAGQAGGALEGLPPNDWRA